MTARHARLWLRSIEDQVPADIGRVVYASKPDRVARGVTLDLLEMAKRVGPQFEAAEYKDLSGEKSLTLDCIAIDIKGAIQPNDDNTEELSMKAPMSVSKLADLG